MLVYVDDRFIITCLLYCLIIIIIVNVNNDVNVNFNVSVSVVILLLVWDLEWFYYDYFDSGYKVKWFNVKVILFFFSILLFFTIIY